MTTEKRINPKTNQRFTNSLNPTTPFGQKKRTDSRDLEALTSLHIPEQGVIQYGLLRLLGVV